MADKGAEEKEHKDRMGEIAEAARRDDEERKKWEQDMLKEARGKNKPSGGGVSSSVAKTAAVGGAVAGGAAGLAGGLASATLKGAQSSAGAFFWILGTIFLYITDIWVTGFDGIGFSGLDFINILVQKTISSIASIAGAVIVAVIGYKILAKNVDRKEAISFGVLIFVMTVIFFMGGFYRGAFHLAFIIIIYLGLIRPSYKSDMVSGNYITTLLVLIDFFLYGAIAYYGNPLFANRLIIPFWFYYVLALTYERVKNPLSWTLIVAVILFNVFTILSNVNAFPAIDKEFTEMQTGQAGEFYKGGLETIRDIPKNVIDQIKSRYQRSIEYAAGGYYEGEVEKAQKEPLGVYIEDIKAADRQFYEDESVTVWATLKVKNLDEDEPVNVKVSCLADKETDKQRKGEMLPRESFEIYTLEEEDLQCRFSPGDLEKGSRKVSMFADFNFKTMAYLKNYFIDEERLRSMRRDDIDVFSHFGITDKKPIAKYTPGPVRVGIESKEPPVGLSVEYDTKPLLGITFSNEDQWQGYIKKINDLIVCIPKSMELDLYSCDADFKPYPEGNIKECGEEHIAYKLSDVEKNKTKYQNIKEFVSFRCRLLITPEKMQDVLGGVPFATKFFRVTANYDYRLEKSTVANVVRTPGFNVQLKPATATANSLLSCVGVHDKKNIKSAKYRVIKIEDGQEITLVKWTDTLPTLANPKKVEVPLGNLLQEESIQKGGRIRCIMEATLDDEVTSDSSIILIKNAAPTIVVKIDQPASSTSDLTCKGNVSDIDKEDVIKVSWEFRDGYFRQGTCEGLKSDQVCEAIVKASELSVGERVRCRMTPSDGEISGTTKEDYVIISS